MGSGDATAEQGDDNDVLMRYLRRVAEENAHVEATPAEGGPAVRIALDDAFEPPPLRWRQLSEAEIVARYIDFVAGVRNRIGEGGTPLSNLGWSLGRYDEGSHHGSAATPVSVGTLLRVPIRLVAVLGDGGSGTSMLVRWLAGANALALTDGDGTVRGSSEHGDWSAPALVPILVSAARLAAPGPEATVHYPPGARRRWRRVSASPLADHLTGLITSEAAGHEVATTTMLERQLGAGRCLVLIDGLDRVGPTPIRRRLVTEIQEWIDRWTPLGNRLVVTSHSDDCPEVHLGASALVELGKASGGDRETTSPAELRPIRNDPDSTPLARADAALALLRTDPTDPDPAMLIGDLLRSPAESTESEPSGYWRQETVRVLAELAVTTPPLLDLLDAIAVTSGPGTRTAALSSLANWFPDRPGTLDILHRVATDATPESAYVRAITLRILADLSTDSRVLDAVEAYLDDGVWWPTVSHELLDLAPGDPRAIAIVERIAADGTTHRSQAFYAALGLLRIRPDDPVALDRCRALLVETEGAVEKMHVARYLAGIAGQLLAFHPGEPTALRILRAMAVDTTAHPGVRVRALAELASSAPTDPVLLPTVTELAGGTMDRVVVDAAALLAVLGPADETVMALLHRLVDDPDRRDPVRLTAAVTLAVVAPTAVRPDALRRLATRGSAQLALQAAAGLCILTPDDGTGPHILHELASRAHPSDDPAATEEEHVAQQGIRLLRALDVEPPTAPPVR